MREDDTPRSHPDTVAEETVVTEPEPELRVTGSFPSDNPFGRMFSFLPSIRSCHGRLIGTIDVVNGERNVINLLIENYMKQDATLVSIAGSFHHPETDRLLKNVCRRFFLYDGHLTLRAPADDDDQAWTQGASG